LSATVLAGKRKIEVREATSLLNYFLEELKVECVPAIRETAAIALHTFARYGKGRHRQSSIPVIAFPMQASARPICRLFIPPISLRRISPDISLPVAKHPEITTR